LIELLSHKNAWFARHAQRVLQERAANKKLDAGAHAALERLAFHHNDETQRLRGLWALHVTRGLTEKRILKGLDDEEAYIRAWTVQLVSEERNTSANVLAKLIDLTRRDKSPIVRRYLASAAQRVPDWFAVNCFDEGGLTSHAVDADDPNLPLLYWYAIEAAVSRAERTDQSQISLLLDGTRLAKVRGFLVRRLASSGEAATMKLLIAYLAESAADVAEQKRILRNMLAGLKGRRKVNKPAGWDELTQRHGLLRTKDAELRALSRSLAVLFGDESALALLRQELSSKDADLPSRQAALATLLDAHDKQLVPILHRLLGEKSLRAYALRGLASYDDLKTADIILSAFASYDPEEKRDALTTLASRASYGRALLEAVAAKKVQASELPAEIVRQLRNLHDELLDEKIAAVWGIVRTTPAERVRLIGQWKKRLTESTGPVDLSLGRSVFAKTCQQCHTLYGVGGKVGPDITGSNRANLDYLLENIFDPSAVIPNDYKMSVLTLKNGRVVSGIIREETPTALTILTANETLVVPSKDVDERTTSSTSMMPEDVLKPLSEADIKALVAYLQHPTQVPLLATAENAREFFNGKDLTGWVGDRKLWSVDKGEIVGKSPGIVRNAFLKSEMFAEDFRLTLKVKLVPNKENSGIQFRSEPLPDGEMKGPQADIGAGWWGKLYEEQGRGLLWDKSGEKHVKTDDWNEYEIIAEGGRVRTYINGKLCVDLTDLALVRRGVFGLQLHAGGVMEVRFKDLKLEVLSNLENKPKASDP
jgi:putative heme-binding domain-containing protein